MKTNIENNKISRKLVLGLSVMSALMSFSASSAFLDYRQEYKHDQELWASKIKLGAGVGKHYFGVESQQKGHIFDDWKANVSEFEYGYRHTINENWRVIPATLVTFTNSGVTYKPQVQVQYLFDSGVVTKLRYRHQFKDLVEKDNQQTSQVTANLAYNYNAFQFELSGNYWKSLDDIDMFNNKDSNWDANFKLGYREKDWSLRPYLELGNISVSSDSSDRQLRSRVGITYSF
ncbi:porin [Photobacterium gaetbulicola]|uniref:Porin n=1 Tax=Photobacterium gaetbulicola TaxID=1295392 RepID=A0A0B9GAF2_9GAMM|nr:oligogalacturonate-specific porin KdgM family protein [Photobacterium gaetbulicola]KHT65574.1 porin [Photobacterium gaetbulicola]